MRRDHSRCARISREIKDAHFQPGPFHPPGFTRRWIALAAFSLGVEIGHQLVVLPLFGLLAASRRKPRDRIHTTTLCNGSAAISCCGAYYLVVALHEQFR